jgi:argininosuccinate synthase
MIGAGMERVVLGYSGGRESAIAIPWLAEQYGAEIVTLTLDLGQGGDLEDVRDRALAAGAVRAHVLDVREEFTRQYILRALKAGALFQDDRSTATMLGRPLIAQKLVEIAGIEQTATIAHGAADDPRIGVAARALNPNITVVTPAMAGSRGGERSAAKFAAECPDEAAFVEITFDRGVPTAINGIVMPLFDLIGSLDIIAGAHGLGRIDHLETPGAGVLDTVHRDLESGTLTDETRGFSRAATGQYLQMIDTGAWFGQLRPALDAYFDRVQEHVNGIVRLKLFKGDCTIVERKASGARERATAPRKKLTYIGTAKA